MHVKSHQHHSRGGGAPTLGQGRLCGRALLLLGLGGGRYGQGGKLTDVSDRVTHRHRTQPPQVSQHFRGIACMRQVDSSTAGLVAGMAADPPAPRLPLPLPAPLALVGFLAGRSGGRIRSVSLSPAPQPPMNRRQMASTHQVSSTTHVRRWAGTSPCEPAASAACRLRVVPLVDGPAEKGGGSYETSERHPLDQDLLRSAFEASRTVFGERPLVKRR